MAAFLALVFVQRHLTTLLLSHAVESFEVLFSHFANHRCLLVQANSFYLSEHDAHDVAEHDAHGLPPTGAVPPASVRVRMKHADISRRPRVSPHSGH